MRAEILVGNVEHWAGFWVLVVHVVCTAGADHYRLLHLHPKIRRRRRLGCEAPVVDELDLDSGR
jgi:hypothetical protein